MMSYIISVLCINFLLLKTQIDRANNTALISIFSAPKVFNTFFIKDTRVMLISAVAYKNVEPITDPSVMAVMRSAERSVWALYD